MASILNRDKNKKVLEADNGGGGAISAELNAQLNARAKAAAERASAAYAAEKAQKAATSKTTGASGETYSYNNSGGGSTPAAPSYSYIPGTFAYQYGYSPEKFNGQYNYTPGTFTGQYGYTPGEFNGQYNYTPGEFTGQYGYTPTEFNGKYNYTPTEFAGQYGYTPTQFQYNSEYTDLINAARDRLANWNYDPNSDASYNAYKNQYTRAGQSAMTDALARYASKTGGVASSYAASAAQQQYNNYMAQLAAKVPELEQLAYGRAADEYARYVNADQDAYSRAFNEYSDWENRQRAQADTEYANAYRQWSDRENMLRQQADTEYNIAWNQYVDSENRRREQANTLYDIVWNQYTDSENRRRQQADTEYNIAWNEYADRENRLRQQADTEYDIAWNQFTDSENRRRQQADTEYANAWDQYTDWQNRLRTQADTDYDIAYRRWQTEEAAREQAAQNAYNASVAAYKAKYGGSGSSGKGGSDNKTESDWEKDPKYVEAKKTAYSLKSKPKELAAYLNGLFQRGTIPNEAIDFLADVYGADYEGWKADQNKPAEEKPASTKRSTDYSAIQSQAKKLVDNPQAAGAYLDSQVANGLITEAEKSTILSVLGIEREANGGNYAGRNRSRVSGWRKESK